MTINYFWDCFIQFLTIWHLIFGFLDQLFVNRIAGIWSNNFGAVLLVFLLDHEKLSSADIWILVGFLCRSSIAAHFLLSDDLEEGTEPIKGKFPAKWKNQGLISGLSYCLCSCSMILLNKVVLSGYNFNAGISLMCYQVSIIRLYYFQESLNIMIGIFTWLPFFFSLFLRTWLLL